MKSWRNSGALQPFKFELKGMGQKKRMREVTSILGRKTTRCGVTKIKGVILRRTEWPTMSNIVLPRI